MATAPVKDRVNFFFVPMLGSTITDFTIFSEETLFTAAFKGVVFVVRHTCASVLAR